MPDENIVVVRCSLCGRPRMRGTAEYPMDDTDYSVMQVLTDKPIGWYSGEDGEVCPEDMARSLANQ